MMLDSDAVLAAIIACALANMEISSDPSLRVDPQAEAYVEGVRTAHDAVKALAVEPRPIVGDAPARVHSALNLVWSSVQADEADGLRTTDEQDEDVLEQLRKLDDVDLRRAGFVLLVARSLVMATQAER